MMDAYAQDIALLTQAAAETASTGDAPGWVGLVVSLMMMLIVAVERIARSRQVNVTQDDAAYARLDERLKNQQKEIDAIRSATTAAMSDHRREIADRLRRLEDDVREAIRKASE